MSQSECWKEKELELYTCQNLNKLGVSLYEELYQLFPEYGEYIPDCSLLGSQIKTSVGIIDALILIGSTLYVVEFKSVRGTEESVGQLQRYRNVVNRAIISPIISAQHDLPVHVLYDISASFLEGIQLMLVAPSFSKQAMLGADVCIQAEKRGDEFHYAMVADRGRGMLEDFHITNIIKPYLQAVIGDHRDRYYQHKQRQLTDMEADSLARSILNQEMTQ